MVRAVSVRRVACVFALALAISPRLAGADEPKTAAAAREAYQRGAAEYDRREYAAAAVDLARADELVPTPVALEMALKAALRADDVALGMELVDRSKRGPAPASLEQTAKAAREKLGPRAGKIVVRCPTRPDCEPRIDGKAAAADTAHWASIGEHVVEIPDGDAVERHPVRVEAGQTAAITAGPAHAAAPSPSPPQPEQPIPPPGVRPPPPPPPPLRAAPVPKKTMAPTEGGISPAWIAVGGGLTAVLGGLAVASGVDTIHKHDAYATSPTKDGKTAGESAQLRTNVLLGATGIAALATAGLALFAVRWSTPVAMGPRAAPNPRRPAAAARAELSIDGPGLVSLRGSF